ncbi:hypothetical protein P775_04730 [Puniceibacterium antarcticum]|uniref:YNCE-like beta-propeller domain-containing protein n=2 Tax=Puniceibacterium antarcticum TaxID=1206336 RepID=A0A2G8RI72_9RHOB|nr:hypothetical protein P775_04730 [Puniceibacterium antarcticum]
MTLVATQLAAGDFAYVTNQNSQELSILDLDARTETARISIPGKPAGVAVDLKGHVFTVSPDSKVVRRLDAAGTILAAAQLDGGPIGVAYDARQNLIFVSDWYNARIWVMDAETLQTLQVLETGSAPAGLTVSEDGQWLASADRDSDQVSIFDLATLDLHLRPTVGARPFGLRFAPDGRLFVANVGTNDMTVLDPVSGEVLGTVKTGERPYGVAFALGRAFVTNQYGDSVSVIDLATLETITTIDVGEYPEGIDTTSDGATIVVANWFSNTVSLIDAATLEVVGEIETADGPRAFGTFIQQRN